MSVVRLERLNKQFGEVAAVKDVDLELPHGGFTVFLGPSGCGKTTTLRMIAGLESVSGGRILIGQRDVTNLDPKDRNIAMVFQNYALYPHKSVAENLAFGLRMRGVPEAEIASRVSNAAGLLGLADLLERRPRQLSGGQMQRVALGRALVRDAEVFLLDEPLSNLDAKLRVQMREEIHRLHQRIGKSMIYVTHDQVEAMTLADRIVIMRHGVVQQIGDPLEIFDRPANLFVATFVGTPEMNVLDLRLDQGVLRGGALSIPVAIARADGPVKAAIRPDHVEILHDSAARHDGVFVVDVCEQLGTTSLLIGTLEGQRLRVLTARVNATAGDRLRVRLPPERVHVFEADGERRLN